MNESIIDFIYYTNFYEDSGLYSKEEISECLLQKKSKQSKKEIETLNLFLGVKFILENSGENLIDPVIIDELNKIIVGSECSYMRNQTKTNVTFIGSSPWDQTEQHLQYICDLYQRKLKESVNKIDLGAWFFWMFLFIHPFKDGNGRTARVLMCHHFNKVFPLITPNLLREEYICIFSERKILDLNDFAHQNPPGRIKKMIKYSLLPRKVAKKKRKD